MNWESQFKSLYSFLDRFHFEVADIEAALLKANDEKLELDEVAQQ